MVKCSMGLFLLEGELIKIPIGRKMLSEYQVIKKSQLWVVLGLWRRERDLNPRNLTVYAISSRAPSAGLGDLSTADSIQFAYDFCLNYTTRTQMSLLPTIK